MNGIKQKDERNGVTKLRREIAPATDMTNPTVAGVDLGDRRDTNRCMQHLIEKSDVKGEAVGIF